MPKCIGSHVERNLQHVLHIHKRNHEIGHKDKVNQEVEEIT